MARNRDSTRSRTNSSSEASEDDVAPDVASEACSLLPYEQLRAKKVALRKAVEARLFAGISLLPDGDPAEEWRKKLSAPPQSCDSSPDTRSVSRRKGKPRKVKMEDSTAPPAQASDGDTPPPAHMPPAHPPGSQAQSAPQQWHGSWGAQSQGWGYNCPPWEQGTSNQGWAGREPYYHGQGPPPPNYGTQGTAPPSYGGQGSVPPNYGGQGSAPPTYGGQGSAPPGYFGGPYGYYPPPPPPGWRASATNQPAATSPAKAQPGQSPLPPNNSQEIIDAAAWRRQRRANKRKWDNEAKERKAAGVNVLQIEVNAKGEITEDGKNEWHTDLKRHCFDYLDLGVVEFSKQKEVQVANMRATLDAKYQYTRPLNEKWVKTKILALLKTERDRLKKHWMNDLGESLTAPAPTDINPAAWKSLVTYWDSPEGRAKSATMVKSRSLVQNINQSGRGGYEGTRKKLKQESGGSPFHDTLSDKVFTPRVGGSVISGQTSKPSTSLFNLRMDSVEKSCARSQTNYDSLHASYESLQTSVSTLQTVTENTSQKVEEQGGILAQLLSLVKKIVPPDQSTIVAPISPVVSDPPVSHVAPNAPLAPVSPPAHVSPPAAPIPSLPTVAPLASLAALQPFSEDPADSDEVCLLSTAKPTSKQVRKSRRLTYHSGKEPVESAKPAPVTSASQSKTTSATKSMSKTNDASAGEIVEIVSAKKEKSNKFREGDFVVLKQPKNALTEGAMGKVLATAGRLFKKTSDSTTNCIVGAGYAAVHIITVLDGSVPLMFPDTDIVPPQHTLADVKGQCILWKLSSMKKLYGSADRNIPLM